MCGCVCVYLCGYEHIFYIKSNYVDIIRSDIILSVSDTLATIYGTIYM